MCFDGTKRLSHQRKTSEKSLDKPVRHHSHRVARLPGRQSRRDPSLFAGRSAVVKGLRRVAGIGENQRDQLRSGIGKRNRLRRRFRRRGRHR